MSPTKTPLNRYRSLNSIREQTRVFFVCALMHIYQDSIAELCVHGDKKQTVLFVDAGPLVYGIGIRYQFAVTAIFGQVY